MSLYYEKDKLADSMLNNRIANTFNPFEFNPELTSTSNAADKWLSIRTCDCFETN